MDPTGGRDSRYNLNYSMSMMNETPEIYGNPTLARPPSGLGQVVMNRGGGLMSSNAQCGGLNNSRGIKRTNSDCFDDRAMGSQTLTGLEGCNTGGGGNGGGVVPDVVDDSFTSLQQKKSPPSNGKKTKGRVKIKMEYIDNKLRRYTTFSKRKTGIMKKAYELSTLTGTQVMLLVASETGHVYTFATRKLQPMITSEAGKALIQTCLNSPDPPSGAGTGDQRMSATGFEETELSYNIGDEDSKDDRSPMSSGESDDSSGPDSPGPNSGYSNSQQNSQNLSQTIIAGNSNATEPHPAHQQQHHHHNNQQHQTQQQQQQQQQTQEILKQSTLGSLNMNSVLYPASALANLPQDVLLSLMQAGHLQIHAEEDGAHQYITIPLSMMPGGLTKVAVKEEANANGRESPPPKEINIKKESID